MPQLDIEANIKSGTEPISKQPYRFAPGFSVRKETFGGILYHYEQKFPDPRVYFLHSPFLIDFLLLLKQHPTYSLSVLIEQTAAHLALPAEMVKRLQDFVNMLIQKQALVPAPAAETFAPTLEPDAPVKKKHVPVTKVLEEN